jgi:hypothetical protein
VAGEICVRGDIAVVEAVAVEGSDKNWPVIMAIYIDPSISTLLSPRGEAWFLTNKRCLSEHRFLLTVIDVETKSNRCEK